jgi:hypothetical protein
VQRSKLCCCAQRGRWTQIIMNQDNLSENSVNPCFLFTKYTPGGAFGVPSYKSRPSPPSQSWASVSGA